MRTVLFFIFLLPFLAFSQAGEPDLRKFSPLIIEQLRLIQRNDQFTFVIAVSGKTLFKKSIEKFYGATVVYDHPGSSALVLSAGLKDIVEISKLPEVIFIDIQRIPREEVAISNFDISTNKINQLHHQYPFYNGDQIVVSIKEQRPDSTDVDIKGRYLKTTLESPLFSSHASIMATIIAGAGNSFYEGKGVSTGATVSSSRFTVLLPEPDAAYQQYNISVQNHSYGTGIENYYGADAAAYDASVITRNHLLHVFSAGNSGSSTGTMLPYSAVPGYANITGSFKMAKNIVTVGHTDSFLVALPLSSKGPAYDGRLKPELVAYGLDGSSGAAAIVSGLALSLQQTYKLQAGNLPQASLLKAILFNSADDAGRPGIDYINGYGSVNALKAIETILQNRFVTSQVSQGVTNSHSLVVPGGIEQLKITLAWTDPPAIANAAIALINDLDLELVEVSTGQTWKPWVLSHFPHLDSLQALPVRKKDALNPAEQITVDLPAAGNYVIKVSGFNISQGPQQSYSLTWQMEPDNSFRWLFPSGSDNLISGQVNVLRWEKTFGNSSGVLEYSFDNGNNWQVIEANADLNKGYYQWNTPDTFVTAKLRMRFSSQDFNSDVFTVSKRFNVRVGFDCPDSILFWWNRQKGVSSYQVYQLGTKYMQPLAVVNDTVIMLSKQSLQSVYFSVAPLLNGKPGMRSFGFNYTMQGVGCYIKSLIPLLLTDRILLDLELGTIFRIKSIGWEKLINGNYVTLQTDQNITDLNVFYSDSQLTQGLNIYRVRIELINGMVIYSDPVSVFYFGDRRYIVFPNPASQGEQVVVRDKDPGTTLLEIYNSAGSKVYHQILQESNNVIPAGVLSKGIYLLRFLTTDNKIETGKLVIY
jgi:hypothetical protein